MREAEDLARRCLPGATVIRHALWRYSITFVLSAVDARRSASHL